MEPDTRARAGSAMLADPLTGHLLDGRYRIGQRIARGGMAAVYEAVDIRLDRVCAVKTMHRSLGDDAEFADRFTREARAAARLSHPNVVNVFDQGEDPTVEGGTLYLVMELVPGHTLRDVIRADRQYGRAIGFRYHDGKPGIVEGLLSRGDRRVGAVIEQVWRDGARFDGWSEHFSFDAWMAAAETAFAGSPVDVDWYTTREREQTEVLPWDHLDSGLDKDWLWEDWQDALSEVEVEDCRWTPCFDCGVCDQMGTEIQVGPTGVTLLGMPALPVRGEGLVPAGAAPAGSAEG